MIAAILFDPFETDGVAVLGRFVQGTFHPQHLRAGEWADPCPQCCLPTRPGRVTIERLGGCDNVVPCRIAAEVGETLGDQVDGLLDNDRRGVLHRSSLPWLYALHVTVTTVRLDDGPLADVELAAVGAASGMYWNSHAIRLAGAGNVERTALGRPDGGATVMGMLGGGRDVERPGIGAVAFGALPFAPQVAGELLLPEFVVAETDAGRWLTIVGDASVADATEAILARATVEPLPRPKEVSVKPNRPASEWRDHVVEVARDRIRAGALQKVVLARELELVSSSDFSLLSIIRYLDRRFPTAMTFSIDGFVGASPELLVAREGRVVRAHPLAGTAARSDDPAVDAAGVAALLASGKDQHEHRITINWLLTELLPFCSYVDAEPEPSVMTMANVHHLATMVEGVLSEPAASILDLVGAVHPTPALGGDPQGEALAMIDELEGIDRRRYGGPTGWVDAGGNGEFAVSVRTAEISGAKASVFAGVGVVADSDPSAELVETQAKFRAMLGALLGP